MERLNQWGVSGKTIEESIDIMRKLKYEFKANAVAVIRNISKKRKKSIFDNDTIFYNFYIFTESKILKVHIYDSFIKHYGFKELFEMVTEIHYREKQLENVIRSSKLKRLLEKYKKPANY